MAGVNHLKEALVKKEFVVSCEIIPGRGAVDTQNGSALLEAENIWKTGLVHALSITDNPGGNPALLADAVALEFMEKEITPLIHLTCKDKNRNFTLSQLYALERQGLNNVLVMTGDYPLNGWRGKARPSFDLDPVQTLMLIKEMNEGLKSVVPTEDVKESPSHFLKGAVVNPFKYTEGELLTQYSKLEKKLFAGADFVITQLGYDFRKFDELQRFVSSLGSDIPLIANVFVLNRGTARLMRKGLIAGCMVSDDLYAVLEKEYESNDKGRAASLERAAQMIAAAKGMGFAGVHIGGMGIDAKAITFLMERAEQLSGRWQEMALAHCWGIANGFYYYQDVAAEQKDAQASLALNSNELAPRVDFVKNRDIKRGYKLSRFFHKLVLTPGKNFYGVLKRNMARKEEKKGVHRTHSLETLSKTMLYGCQDCGDCGLETCVYSCPMSYCPKCQRNGPCGGSSQGYCEVYPNERFCIWYRAYYRLKAYGETESLSSYITPPNDWSYYETSGWSNYTHVRDNAAKRIYLNP